MRRLSALGAPWIPGSTPQAVSAERPVRPEPDRAQGRATHHRGRVYLRIGTQRWSLTPGEAVALARELADATEALRKRTAADVR